MTRFEVKWSELKKAIVSANNKEEAEQKAYDLPDSEVHQETMGLAIKKLRKVI